MSGFDLIKNEISNVYDSIEKSYYNKGKITGLHTGFHHIDTLLCGLQKSNLVVISGRPAIGKTSFALNIIENAASKYRTTAAIFSFEMSKEILIKRLLCSQTKVNSIKLRCGDLEYYDWKVIAETLDKLSDAPIYINDSVSLSVLELCEECKKLKKKCLL